MTAADPTLDRLIRHMAWANAALFERLATCSDEDLWLAAPRNEWTAARILGHLVSAAGRYAARLEGLPRVDEARSPRTVAELARLAKSLTVLGDRASSTRGRPSRRAA